ncbi:nucleolar protein 10, putative [Ichthyophthirius multifiliis]|uniref:Nucleolar protein 10, putative n=1 Tax=Ichthyophthirius multifiliis TaxID=5932 RepID=G0QVJ4_ICHMU|nr:nucleolar protein 10, putative [Ichthyophthirius multifiliis]EGR30754.1 nucleolar protein 10, putative [Ichthyophthirius multifiliis]|eukprot:XP_004032341.1 nucleolar protein 10, putative [Ichthyophthirius multifiliis]
MSYTITEVNGVKTYNLSAGKTLPQFLQEAKKKNSSLKYNQDFRKRIELIQDFEFPISCNQVEITPDEKYIVTTGTYAPTIKIFETAELSMKCLRGVDSEIVKFAILDQDYSKLAFAQSDRNIEFHAQYGKHYKTRIPKFPRDITYNPYTCDLLISASSKEIYRISLEEGQFLKSFESACSDINTLSFNKQLNILASGGNDGIIEIWDYRQREKASNKIFNNGQDITYCTFDSSGMVFAAGSDKGLVRLYDIRQESPILEIKHHYKLPINTIAFHEKSRNIISSNERVIKINNQDNGKVFTSIEPNSGINRFCLCPNSGLLLVAQEESRLGTYFIPQMDNAPRWCNFLENITEELEESQSNLVYDEFKFLTYDELEKLQATNLLGSAMLKVHLHGYLMHMKLYNKLLQKADLFSFQDYQKNLVKKKISEQQQSRVSMKNKVQKNNNQDLFQDKDKVNNPLMDNRFKGMFINEDFAIDKNNEEYLRLHPSEGNRGQKSDNFFVDEEGNLGQDDTLQIKMDQRRKKLDLQQKKMEKIQKSKAIQKEKAKKYTFEDKIKKQKKNFKNKQK